MAESPSESDNGSVDGAYLLSSSPISRDRLQKRIESLSQQNKVLKVELETYKIRVKDLQEENKILRQTSVNIQAKAEQEEEYISNILLKKIQSLKKEKETLAINYEQEEESLTNDLSRKLSQLRHEKEHLELTLEHEQEGLVNKLMNKIHKLEAETSCKQQTLDQLKREKVELENTLEQEQEALVNKLWKKMEKLEAEKRALSTRLEKSLSGTHLTLTVSDNDIPIQTRVSNSPISVCSASSNMLLNRRLKTAVAIVRQPPANSVVSSAAVTATTGHARDHSCSSMQLVATMCTDSSCSHSTTDSLPSITHTTCYAPVRVVSETTTDCTDTLSAHSQKQTVVDTSCADQHMVQQASVEIQPTSSPCVLVNSHLASATTIERVDKGEDCSKANCLSVYVKQLRSQVQLLREQLRSSQIEHSERMAQFARDERQIRVENDRLQRSLAAEIDRREILCRNLSESESSLDLERDDLSEAGMSHCGDNTSDCLQPLGSASTPLSYHQHRPCSRFLRPSDPAVSVTPCAPSVVLDTGCTVRASSGHERRSEAAPIPATSTSFQGCMLYGETASNISAVESIDSDISLAASDGSCEMSCSSVIDSNT